MNEMPFPCIYSHRSYSPRFLGYVTEETYQLPSGDFYHGCFLIEDKLLPVEVDRLEKQFREQMKTGMIRQVQQHALK